jgi:hypothetical protein
MNATTNGMDELNAMIKGTCEAFADSKQRWKAMKAIQWRFRGPCGEFVGNRAMRAAFVSEAEATIFDGRDNAEMKQRFFEAVLKYPLTVEILPQSK